MHCLFTFFVIWLISEEKKSILANISRLEKYSGQELKEFLLKANYSPSTTPTVGVDFLFKSFFLSFFVCFTQWTEPMKRGGRRWGKETLVIMMAQSNSVLFSLVIHWFRLLLYWWIRQDGEPTSSFAWSNGEVWIFTLNLSLSTFRLNLVVSYRKSWNLMGHSTRCLYHDRW